MFENYEFIDIELVISKTKFLTLKYWGWLYEGWIALRA